MNQAILLRSMSATRKPWQRTFCINITLDYNDDIFNLALDDLQDKVLSMGVGNSLSMACHSLRQLTMIGLQGFIIEK